MKRVLKWVVPVDDLDHPIGWGPVVHVDCLDPQRVLVWTEETVDDPKPRRARVYGTGHPVPDADLHIGSVTAGPFVWHVYGASKP